MPATETTKGAGFGPMYPVMRFIGERCAAHFFRDVAVVGGQDVPKEGPILVCCTHFSTIMDVAVISAKLPHRRPIHYWAKRGLYKRQPFRWILENSGNIQVDRKTKNNQDLFAGTFKAMEAGEAIGLFPEGGSYTEHRLHSMKAGAAWAALEYAKHRVQQGATSPAQTELLIVPAAINYTDKSRFRGQALFTFGPAFSLDQYTEQFLSDDASAGPQEYPFHQPAAPSLPATPGPSTIVPGRGGEGPHPESRMRMGLDVDEPAVAQAASVTLGGSASKAPTASTAARAAVAKLTDRIGAEIYKMTIDAPDWTTWHSIKMARELLWKRGGDLPLANLVPISNALVAVLNAPLGEARRANEALCTLQALVVASSTDVFTLNVVGQRFTSTTLSPEGSTSIPSRASAEAAVPSLVSTSAYLLLHLAALAIRLPYVAPLAVIYLPAYVAGWGLSLRYASHEEESMASAKSLCAFVIAALTHGLLIVGVAALFLFTPPGWLIGFALSYGIERAHVWLLDETYDRIKILVAAYRLFAASLRRLLGERQLAGEDEVTQVVVDVVKREQAIQWTYTKALRMHAQRDGSKVRLTRPPCSQMMGATLQAHADAAHALAVLFQALKRLEHAKEQRTGKDLGADVFAQWTYLRGQMQVRAKKE